MSTPDQRRTVNDALQLAKLINTLRWLGLLTTDEYFQTYLQIMEHHFPDFTEGSR